MRCLRLIGNVLSTAHKAGITPYSYNLDDDGERQQHYKATAFWTTVIAFAVATSFYATNFDHVQDDEHKIFNGLDHFGHQAFAAVALVGLSAALGALAGLAHAGINKAFGVKDRSGLNVQASHHNDDDEGVALTETGSRVSETYGSLGKDNTGANVYRVGPWEPINLVYPPTPVKTMAWVATIALVAFAIGSLIDPRLFNAIAGDGPLANGTFTNCTVGNETVLNTTGCVEDIGHIGAVATLGMASALVVGGVATLFHAAGVGATKRCKGDAQEHEEGAGLNTTNPLFNSDIPSYS